FEGELGSRRGFAFAAMQTRFGSTTLEEYLLPDGGRFEHVTKAVAEGARSSRGCSVRRQACAPQAYPRHPAPGAGRGWHDSRRPWGRPPSPEQCTSASRNRLQHGGDPEAAWRVQARNYPLFRGPAVPSSESRPKQTHQQYL